MKICFIVCLLQKFLNIYIYYKSGKLLGTSVFGTPWRLNTSYKNFVVVLVVVLFCTRLAMATFFICLLTIRVASAVDRSGIVGM